MKRVLALFLGLMLALTGVVMVSAEDELPEALFTYDFTADGAAVALGYGTADVVDCELEYDGEGYSTFVAAEGDKEATDGEYDMPDCYFKFGDAHQPSLFCCKANYIVIKYRTTESCKGQFYTNRSDLAMWGQDGTFVEWNWEPCEGDEWNLALIDASMSWGAVADGVTFEAFRFDPLDGAEEGSTIDVAYIKFFETREDADDFRKAADPEKYTFYTATFLKEDGSVRKVVLFRAGDTELDGVPSVPRKKGYTGEWEPYTLGAENIEIRPIYTPENVEVDPPVESATESATETETETEAVTTTVVEEGTTAPEVATTTAPAATEDGCKSVIASASILGAVALAAGVVICRKKEND